MQFFFQRGKYWRFCFVRLPAVTFGSNLFLLASSTSWHTSSSLAITTSPRPTSTPIRSKSYFRTRPGNKRGRDTRLGNYAYRCRFLARRWEVQRATPNRVGTVAGRSYYTARFIDYGRRRVIGTTGVHDGDKETLPDRRCCAVNVDEHSAEHFSINFLAASDSSRDLGGNRSERAVMAR